MGAGRSEWCDCQAAAALGEARGQGSQAGREQLHSRGAWAEEGEEEGRGRTGVPGAFQAWLPTSLLLQWQGQ